MEFLRTLDSAAPVRNALTRRVRSSSVAALAEAALNALVCTRFEVARASHVETRERTGRATRLILLVSAQTPAAE